MKKSKERNSTLIHFILDKSGSMDAVLDATISGFNEYLTTLKKSKEDVRFSLTLFDTISIDTPYVNVPVKKVKPLSRDTYNPTGGTPLYDAVVDSVEALYEEIGDAKKTGVVITIMTDGEENSSRKHTQECLKKLVKKLEKKGNWTFAYMGANQDAWANAAAFGISAGNTMSWESSERGTDDAFRGVAMASMNYAAYAGGGGAGGGSKGILRTSNLFNDLKEDDETVNGKGGGKNAA